MTCMNILSVYSMISTIVIVFMTIFLVRCGSEVKVVDGDSESVTKTDIGWKLLIAEAQMVGMEKPHASARDGAHGLSWSSAWWAQ